ncbi:MAG: hypothetical protein V4616_02635 [Bacteroidota bacterium]
MRAVYIAAVCILVACGTAKVATPPTPPVPPKALTDADHVARGAEKFPGYTLEQFVEGRTQYDTKCQSCHALYKPEDYDEADWRGVVPGMVRRTNKQAKMTLVTPEQEELMVKYLVAMAKN